MTVLVVLHGGPGAGKGTQAKEIVEKTGATHVATGDMFRQHLKEKTSLGILAQRYTDNGHLVPDDVTIDMLRERLQLVENGLIILDGFPRNIAQADALWELLEDMGITFGGVIYLAVREDVLKARLLGRKEGRTDDDPKVILKRLNVYLDQTAELIPYFTQLGVLHTINGEKTVDEVAAAVWDVLEKILQPA